MLPLILLACSPARAAEPTSSWASLPALPLAHAEAAWSCARARDPAEPATLTLIDFSQASGEERLWVLDMEQQRVLHQSLVAHGSNSGVDRVRSVSDVPGSKQSSVGVYRTAERYQGKNGLSLRLDGLEPGFNGKARERAIVMHGADYVSADFVAEHGRLGRSWGCPALPSEDVEVVIDRIEGGSLLLVDYPEPAWLEGSTFLHCPAG